MTASPADDRLARLRHEIGLRTYADRFLDDGEEREVLAIAARMGLPDAATHIAAICRADGTAREADVRNEIAALIARESGKLDEAGFDRVAAALDGPLGDRDRQRMIAAVIDRTGHPIRRGWFSNWYAKRKRTLGMA
jgi:hypothetical protein